MPTLIHTPKKSLLHAVVGAFAALALSGLAIADEIDIAVDAVVIAGSIAGVPLGNTEADLTKVVVRCAVKGKTLLVCSRELVLSHMPVTARPLATCIVTGRDVLACARDEAVRQLPPGSQPIAGCVANGRTVQECGTEEMLRRLPPDVRAIATCLAQRPDAGACVTAAARSTSQHAALNVIDRLKADARSDAPAVLAGTSGPVRNIIDIVQGIRDDDWIKVSLAGGGEVYKAAAKIVIRILLPPIAPAGVLIDPVIDYVVQGRIDALQDFMSALRRRDVPAIGRIIVEAYLVQNLLVCAIPGVPQEIKDLTCGPAGRIINFAGSIGEDAVGAVTSALGAVGSGVAEGWRLIRKDNDCGTAQQHYMRHYALCYHAGTALQLSDPAGAARMHHNINQQCRRHFNRCYDSGDFGRLCNPQRELFIKHVEVTTKAVRNAAAFYSRSFAGFLARDAAQAACQPRVFAAERKQFVDACEISLSRQFRLGRLTPTGNACGPVGSQPIPTANAWRLACDAAVPRIDSRPASTHTCATTRRLGKRTTEDPAGAVKEEQPRDICASAAKARARVGMPVNTVLLLDQKCAQAQASDPPIPDLSALVTREADNGPLVVKLRITPTSSLPVAKAARVSYQRLFRDGQVIDKDLSVDFVDRTATTLAKYKVCWQLVAELQWVCSREVESGTLGALASFRNVNSAKAITHSSFMGWVDRVETSEQKIHATFVVRGGLAPIAAAISLEVATSPGFFFVNDGGRIWVLKTDGTQAFNLKASFRIVPSAGASEPRSRTFKLESVFEPGRFLALDDSALVFEPPSADAGWSNRATFVQIPALWPKAIARLRGQ